jgi:hypothetical protein
MVLKKKFHAERVMMARRERQKLPNHTASHTGKPYIDIYFKFFHTRMRKLAFLDSSVFGKSVV